MHAKRIVFSHSMGTQIGLSHPVQLFTPEKQDTLAFHIMTKEIYPHSVLLAQFNPSKQVRTPHLNPM